MAENRRLGSLKSVRFRPRIAIASKRFGQFTSIPPLFAARSCLWKREDGPLGRKYLMERGRKRMDLYRVVPLRENLWAISEVGKTVMYVINGKDKALLLDTGFGMVPLKQVVHELCGEKPLMVANSHGHLDHNSGNNQFDTVYVGRYRRPREFRQTCSPLSKYRRQYHKSKSRHQPLRQQQPVRLDWRNADNQYALTTRFLYQSLQRHAQLNVPLFHVLK